jgi:hypothetical protein
MTMQQKALTDADTARQRLTTAEQERDRYKAEVERLHRRNFWQWLLGR